MHVESSVFRSPKPQSSVQGSVCAMFAVEAKEALDHSPCRMKYSI